MKMPRILLAFCVCAMCVVSVPVVSSAAAPPDHQVAITIDDLPAGAANSMSAATITDMTTKLLGTLRDQKIPIVGFVNEKKLYKLGEVDQRINALRMWLDYGFELANHTFSHM
jgi:peptidoglycan/xylan/chitin deacetylase (PgdA/CDA1 family)